jgi:hypothetical protein
MPAAAARVVERLWPAAATHVGKQMRPATATFEASGNARGGATEMGGGTR